MRDIALLVDFIGCVPCMGKRPALGVDMWD